MSSLLREARLSRGWSSARLRHELTRAATRRGVPVATDSSLRVLISRWENGHSEPDDINRSLLQEVYGLDAGALGLAEDRVEIGYNVSRLLAHVVRRELVPAPVLGYFGDQLRALSRLDNTTGPHFVIATATAQLHQVEQLAAAGPTELAALTARFAEFTGWLHQDLGDSKEAGLLTARAVDFAYASGDQELVTYNLMRRANILTGTGDHHLAASIAGRALLQAQDLAPHLEAICLRQQALTAAHLEDESTSLTAIERALSLAAAGTETGLGGPAAYCTTPYVQMEAARCLLLLGRAAEAEQACVRALQDWPTGLDRDRSLCLARRSSALADLNELHEACAAALAALESVRSAPSGRALQVVRRIVPRLRRLGRHPIVQELTDALAEVA